MSGKQATQSPLLAPSVHGLDGGRQRARRRAATKRVKNAITAGVMFVLAVVAVGTAGYLAWQEFGAEQERNETNRAVVVQPTDDELIERFENAPRWNGPGAPAFGVGDEAQP